jgi:hypothetical protein
VTTTEENEITHHGITENVTAVQNVFSRTSEMLKSTDILLKTFQPFRPGNVTPCSTFMLRYKFHTPIEPQAKL